MPHCEQPLARLEKCGVGVKGYRHELLAIGVGALAEKRYGVLISKTEAASRRSDSDVTAPDPI
jgi:hypothetical protein